MGQTLTCCLQSQEVPLSSEEDDVTDSSPTQPSSKRPKGRSPSYPALDLKTAIDRARRLYEQERHHATPVETAVRHWGYKSLSGPANGALAALKKFGLSLDEGSGATRRVRLTDLAVDIIANPDQVRREAAIRQAALTPPIHRELWDRWGRELPSDENLRWELHRERGFTETGATEFIAEYRATIDFAKLEPRSEVDDGGRDDGDDDGDRDGDAEAEDQVEHQGRGGLHRNARRQSDVDSPGVTYLLPVAINKNVTVAGGFPLTEQEWVQLMAVLAAMKPALVAATPIELDVEEPES